MGAAILFTASVAVTAQESSEGPLWMRYSAISPDGSTIAFAYKGDIFTVPVTGGQARQITSNSAFDSRPVRTEAGSRSHLTVWEVLTYLSWTGTVESLSDLQHIRPTSFL